jgi:hypothetical protein
MVDADLENLGIAGPGEGMRLLPARFNGWHRWEQRQGAAA